MTDGGDPSTRTINQVKMSIEHLNQVLEGRIREIDAKLEGMREEVKTERNAAQKAVDLIRDRVSSQPTPDVLSERLISLAEVVKIQFAGLKELASTLAVSNEEKLKLALSSQQDAAKKAEDAFMALLLALAERLDKQLDAISARLDDLRDQASKTTGSKEGTATMIAIAAVVVSILSPIIAGFLKS